jgi:Ca-activated chloride channel family protein
MLALFLGYCATTFADNTAANKSREGIEAFQRRDFQAAQKSFEEAENAAPDDLRLAFDRGCAFAACGDWEKAVEQFQKSAASSDQKLSARSNYNLGCVKILEARAKFGEKPEEAAEEIRKQGLEMLVAADRHFRDALAIDSQDENARYNLETLRSWSHYIRKAWRDRDRQLRREKADLFEYLRMLEADQRELMSKVQELQNVPGDSPRKRQSIREAENAERELLEEIGPLKEKIERLAAGQGGKTALPADVQKAVAVLKNIADEIGRSMESAADRLAKPTLAESIEPQQKAVENLDQIFSAVAPYVPLVQKGIERQEKLLEEKSEGQGGENADAAWNQRFIERYGKIIPLKARQELKQLESQPASPSQKTEDVQKEPDKEAQDDAAAKAQRQRQEMKEALQVGIELSPKVEQLAQEAAELLSQEKPADALPKQQEALKLLKEMLPKEQQQEQQKKDQEKKDQQKKNQDKKDQDKKDQQKKDRKDDKKDQKQQTKEQDKKDQKKKDEEKKEDKKKNQENKDEKKKDDQKKDTEKNSPKKDEKQPPSGEASPQKKEISKEQAEASLRRAKQRQIEYRELQEELREKLYRPEKVEKDW